MKTEKLKITVLATGFLAVVATIFIPFMAYHQERVLRDGFHFDDPVHGLFPAYDVSFPIFSITYGSILLYLILKYREDHFLPKLLFTYGFILSFRIITMSTLPLKAPLELVHLQDPFLNNLIYPGDIVTDLFFSGHTALVFSIFLLSGKKWIFLLFTVAMAVLLMIQRVHYSIDVLAAIPFAWLAVFLASRLVSMLSSTNSTN